MFVYPDINPVAFHIGPLKVHWYGLMYLLSFFLGWGLAYYRNRKLALGYSSDAIADLVFYVALGVILGGRIGYMLFYDFIDFIHHPWIIVQVWNGGMSFHGGLLGVGAALWWWSRKHKTHFFDLTDFIAPIVPMGLGFGRLGNFLTGDLWGRVTHVPWAMIYPYVDMQPRHPSEIYESLLEGIVLFTLLWMYASKKRPRMAVTGLFLIGYAAARIFCEFFRQPDVQIGFIYGNWLTLGQLLSLPMLLLGIIFWVMSHKK